jgi:hypothetical protein
MRDGPIGSDQVQAMAGQTSHVKVLLLSTNGAATLTAASELKSAEITSPNKNMKLQHGT